MPYIFIQSTVSDSGGKAYFGNTVVCHYFRIKVRDRYTFKISISLNLLILTAYVISKGKN